VSFISSFVFPANAVIFAATGIVLRTIFINSQTTVCGRWRVDYIHPKKIDRLAYSIILCNICPQVNRSNRRTGITNEKDTSFIGLDNVGPHYFRWCGSRAALSGRIHHAGTIATNGTTLHVRIGGMDPAVVMLHGYGETGDMWVPLAIELARDHTVIVPDLRGMGLVGSSQLAGTTRRHKAQ
jgi:hypothetical protein